MSDRHDDIEYVWQLKRNMTIYNRAIVHYSNDNFFHLGLTAFTE